MVDPTWTRTCACGAKVNVNQLGQHHHTNCEHNPLNPGCCDDPAPRREFYHAANAGVQCDNCGHRWPGDRRAYLEALAHHLTIDWTFDVRQARGVTYRSNLRLVETAAGGVDGGE